MNDELNMNPIPLSKLTENFSLYLIGEDAQISKFGNLSSRSVYPEKQLTYVNSRRYLDEFNNSNTGACIIHESLVEHSLPHKSYLVTTDDPEHMFYNIFMFFIQKDAFQCVNSYRGVNNTISKTAIIHDSVRIGNECIIMDNVVLMPNTIVGDRVTIKPNTVIGGDGFQVKVLNGKRKIIPHRGGVRIFDDVEIGSNVTIDKGLFGEFTIIKKQVKIDNLVHIAHSAYISDKTLIAAGSIIAGGVSVGKNVWLGIKSSVNQLIEIGDYSFIGASTAVVKEIKPFEKYFGVPARKIGYLCVCRHDLKQTSEEGLWGCSNCETQYYYDSNQASMKVRSS